MGWSHIDLPTTQRFFTFLYMGDFNTPDPVSIRVGPTSNLHISPSAETDSVDDIDSKVYRILKLKGRPINITLTVLDNYISPTMQAPDNGLVQLLIRDIIDYVSVTVTY